MKKSELVAVTSRSFSKHPVLRSELLAQYENVKFNDKGEKLSGSQLLNFLQSCEKAIIGLEMLDEAMFKQLPQLKVIAKFGVGLDRIDLSAMKKFGIRLGHTPGTNKRAVSELVIGLTISLLRQLPLLNQEVRQGIWRQPIGQQLSSKVFGIIGFGSIGRDLADLLKPFNCNILTHDIADSLMVNEQYVTSVSLDTLLQTADIISLHLPLNDATYQLLNADRLALIKPTAILINTARGELVDVERLKILLYENRIAGAAFDVFSVEPYQDQALLLLPNFLATPHIGGSTADATLAMGRAAIMGLDHATTPDATLI